MECTTYIAKFTNMFCCYIGNGNLVSGTSLNVRASSYGLSLSHSPFNGTASVSTINYYISFQGMWLVVSKTLIIHSLYFRT